jgi:hypothetical protein
MMTRELIPTLTRCAVQPAWTGGDGLERFKPRNGRPERWAHRSYLFDTEEHARRFEAANPKTAFSYCAQLWESPYSFDNFPYTDLRGSNFRLTV